MKSLIKLGKIESPQTASRIGHGKAISPMFFSTLCAIISAALSACMKNGIGQVFPRGSLYYPSYIEYHHHTLARSMECPAHLLHHSPLDSAEFKVAADHTWTLNYGAEGKKGGANVNHTMSATKSLTITFNPSTFIISASEK